MGKIVVFGAGTIGAYVGGSLLATGADVLLIGRARMREWIAGHGLHLTDLRGRQLRVAAGDVPYGEDPAALAQGGLILLTVKSADTAAAADAIAVHAPATAPVLSLQNGVGNLDLLRARLPGRTIIGGMVPFNVAQLEAGRLHRGTDGELMVEQSPALAPWRDAFRAAQLPLIERDDFQAVQWGKLLLNLNNPVNALSGLPLKTELSQRAYRRCLALLIDEALATLGAASIAPAKIGRVAPRLLPALLRLPDAIFTRLAASMLKIDPEARSSMWDDLQAGRRTEIDYLNGAVVALARKLGRDAPANRRMIELMRAAEAGSGSLDGAALYRALDAGSPGR